MGNQQAVHIKARAVLRQLGYADADAYREYKDWHIEIRGGLAYVSVWSSAGMVFLSLANIPVFYRPGPWEQYLDRLFNRLSSNGRGREREQSTRLREILRDPPEPSADS